MEEKRAGIRSTYAGIVGMQAIVILVGLVFIRSPMPLMVHVLIQGFIMYVNTLVLVWKLGTTYRVP